VQAMPQTNLAAAILHCASTGLAERQPREEARLSIEDAISLANWLQHESPIGAWRSIHLQQSLDLLSMLLVF